MNVHQVMQCYQQTLDYYKEAAFSYFMSQPFSTNDRKNIKKLFYAFIEMCPFHELFMGMLNKEEPGMVIRKEIDKYDRTWKNILLKLSD